LAFTRSIYCRGINWGWAGNSSWITHDAIRYIITWRRNEVFFATQILLMASRCSYVDGYRAQLTPFRIEGQVNCCIMQQPIPRFIIISIILDHLWFAKWIREWERFLCTRVAINWEKQVGLMASRCSYVDGCRAQLTPFQLRANNVIQWLISRYVTSIILDIIFGSLIQLESERDSFVCLSRMGEKESCHTWKHPYVYDDG